MYQILHKDRHGDIHALPTIYENHYEADHKIKEYASHQQNLGATEVKHLKGISTAYFDDGSQAEYWRDREEVLQINLPIF